MIIDLVEMWTSDGVRLHGALQTLESSSTHRQSTEDLIADAALLLPGVGGNFYGSSLIAGLAAACTSAGVAALRVNTRGHDTICTVKTRIGGLLQGGAFESVDECRHDIDGWVQFLTEQGYERVVLIGHSLGAIKALYSQSQAANPAVAAVIPVSPPRLNHDVFRQADSSPPFLDSLAQAQALVADGQANTVFHAKFPFPMHMTASTFLDKYGPESRYDILKFAHNVTVPCHFVYGELELAQGGIAFHELDSAVAGLDWRQPPSIEIVPAANHFYSGVEDQLEQLIVNHVFPAANP